MPPADFKLPHIMQLNAPRRDSTTFTLVQQTKVDRRKYSKPVSSQFYPSCSNHTQPSRKDLRYPQHPISSVGKAAMGTPAARGGLSLYADLLDDVDSSASKPTAQEAAKTDTQPAKPLSSGIYIQKN